jgi:hypothetical protein
MFVLVTGCSLAAAAFGVEPPCPENRVEFQVKVHSPWLAKVPILKELFEELGKQQAEAQAVQHGPVQQAPSCPQAQERIGVDFAFPTVDGPVVMFSHPLLHGPGCVPGFCPAPAMGCAVCDEAKCLLSACGAGVCCEQGKCQAATAKSSHCCCDECECGDCQCSCTCCAAQSTARSIHHHELFERLLEAQTERAALEATVEAHEALAEAREESYSSVAELMVENAQLKAKLEFQAEKEELHKQLAELAAQNAQLKSEVALTEAKARLSIESTLLALEKERLQARVAELEKKAAGEGIRTAKRNKTTR